MILKKPEEGSDGVVPAAFSSTVVAGLSVPEPAIATESAGNSRPEDNTQLSEDEKSQQATPHEGSESMQRDSNVQPQYPQSEESTEVADVETSPESNDAPEEDGGTNDRSGESTSQVASSLSIDTATRPADGEHQVHQIAELPAENEVRSTGTGTTGTERSLSLEAGDRSSERTMNSDSSLTPSKRDAETTSAENTDNISRTEGDEVSSEEGKEAPQTVDTAPGNTNTAPGETGIPSESNATTPSDHDILLENVHLGELAAMYLIAESTVHVYVSRVLLLLLLLLGLWGTAALR
ncbi:complement regulatory protein [Trypanosoma cruzi Dm28c]|uniref:Complement regulatory protein n=1 Tax=Trypanosoma cruzi Dm28c TaxID=1416333 RepID=V5A374_TRYCR|nr:complement regulatory protein [Trypanosoma cruzi Dm28c]KAF8288915.1 complement regulatory protein [Trypanosoma cruzi]